MDTDGEHGIADVGIADGVIAAVEPELSVAGDTEFDADGLVLMPGVVDSTHI